MTNPATPTPTDLPEPLRLADEYAETRHRCGSHLHNAKTEAARNALHAALSAAAPAAPADLITIRKPTTRAEVEWLAKLAHLLVSDVNDTLQRVLDGAPQAQQPTAPQEGVPDWSARIVAPFPGMDEPWPEEEKQRLDRVLGEVFGWPQAGAESYPPSDEECARCAGTGRVDTGHGAAGHEVYADCPVCAGTGNATAALRARGAMPKDQQHGAGQGLACSFDVLCD